MDSVQRDSVVSSMAGGERWYAVHTRSNFEKRVSIELDGKGLEEFLPVIRETHRWKDRNKIVETPVFPGYVFVRMEASNENRLAVLRCAGVARILGFNGGLEPVPDNEIESIQILLRSKVPFSLHPYLHEGARVRVTRGPLRGAEGMFVRAKNRETFVVSIELLSQSVATEIDSEHIEEIRA